MAPPDRITSRARPLVAALAVALGLGVGLGVLACGSGPDEDPRLREKTLLFDGEALRRMLALAAQLDETPIASAARRWQPAVADCATAFAAFDAPGATPDCIEGAGLDDEGIGFLRQLRGEADGLLLWPLGDDGRVALRLRVDPDGSVEIEGDLRPPSGVASWRLLVPAAEAPAAPVLPSANAFVHARGRPAEGLGLAALMPDGGQADRLFALKGRLLEGALLAGTWELAILPPAADGSLPLPVAALHHRAAAPVEHALAEALDQLEATWPIRRAPRSFTLASGATIEGGCFPELPLLPEFAPCWVVTPRAFVIAYRGAALDAALAASDPSTEEAAPERDRGGSLRVELGWMARRARAEARDATRAHPGDLFSQVLVDLRAGTTTPVALRARLARGETVVGQVAP